MMQPRIIEPKRQGAFRAKALWITKCLRLFAVLAFCVPAYAAVTLTPTSWNVVGLDSNNPTSSGPDTFQIGARFCNTGGAAVTSIAATFVWDSSNSFIALSGASTVNLASLSGGACTDFYFPVTVTRSSSAYNATRGYHITVSGTGFSSISTVT